MRHKTTGLLWVALLGFLTSLVVARSQAQTRPEVELPKREGATWLTIAPRQCEDPVSAAEAWNPDPSAPIDVARLKRFYRKRGMRVVDAKIVFSHEPVCEACHTCSAGHTLYLQVSDSDLPELLSMFGYRIVEPDHETRPSDDQSPRGAR